MLSPYMAVVCPGRGTFFNNYTELVNVLGIIKINVLNCWSVWADISVRYVLYIMVVVPSHFLASEWFLECNLRLWRDALNKFQLGRIFNYKSVGSLSPLYWLLIHGPIYQITKLKWMGRVAIGYSVRVAFWVTNC